MFHVEQIPQSARRTANLVLVPNPPARFHLGRPALPGLRLQGAASHQFLPLEA